MSRTVQTDGWSRPDFDGRVPSSALFALFLVLLLACSDAANPASPPDSSVPADAAVDSDAGSPPRCPDLVIDGVTVVDADGVRRDQVVALSRERIESVVGEKPAWPPDCRVVDGRGRFLVPGLVDSHAHLTYSGASGEAGDPLEANLRASLYNWVLAVFDVGASTSIFALREALERGTVLGPTVRATGPFFTAPGSHPCEFSPFADCIFVAPGTARERAADLLALRPDALKLALADTANTPWPTPRLEAQVVPELVAAAGPVPVVAHVDSNLDLLDALAGGARFLAHPVFVEELSAPALAASTSAKAIHTTLGAFGAAPDLVDGVFDLDDPGLLVADGVLEDWRYIKENPDVLAPGWLAATRTWTAHAEKNLLAMRAAGAHLLPGSDAGYAFVPHGLGLHRELQHLQRLGFEPSDLLRAATLDAREAIGLEGGRIAPGEPADLLLLSDDPTLDIAALGSIEEVIVRGRVFDREELRTVALVLEPGSAGEACLGPADCAAGLGCDRVAHLCREACGEPHAVTNACGPAAWCMPSADAVEEDSGVCHSDPGCDLYSASCEQAYYGMQCTPLDVDTNACLLTGTALAGEACVYDGPGTSCAQGLYCSPLDLRCYRLCDAHASEDGCPPSESCEPQIVEGHTWFGVCLP